LGKEIKAHFAEKEVGLVDCWNGDLNDQAVTVFCSKEPDYVMSIMSACGTVNEEGAVKKRKGADGNEQVHTFCYMEVFHNHYRYRHVVDDNNSNCMQLIMVEESWKTGYWPNRVFTFILGVTGINTQQQLGVQERAYERNDPQPRGSCREGGSSIKGEQV
jgi:hypothetical protein